MAFSLNDESIQKLQQLEYKADRKGIDSLSPDEQLYLVEGLETLGNAEKQTVGTPEQGTYSNVGEGPQNLESKLQSSGSPFNNAAQEAGVRAVLGALGGKEDLQRKYLEKIFGGPQNVQVQDGAFFVPDKEGVFRPVNRSTGVSTSIRSSKSGAPVVEYGIQGDLQDVLGDVAQGVVPAARFGANVVAGNVAGPLGVAGAEGLGEEAVLAGALAGGLLTPEEFKKRQPEVLGKAAVSGVLAKGGELAVKGASKVASGLGEFGRNVEKKFFPEDLMRKEAGKIRAEGLTRELEGKIKGASGTGLAERIQAGLRKKLDKYTSDYSTAYKVGDALALSEGKAGQKLFTADLDGRLSSLVDDFKVTDVNRELVPAMFQKINKERAALGLGEYTPGQATSFDTKVAKEFIDKQFKKFPLGDPNRILLNEMRNNVFDTRNELAQAGSKAAQKLVEGDAIFKKSFDDVPESLREKILETSVGYGKVQKVTPTELYKRISAPPSASGASSNTFLNEDELSQVQKLLKLNPKQTAKDLMGSTLTSGRFAKSMKGTRPKIVSEDANKLASALSEPGGIEAYQASGGALNPDYIKKTLNPENVTGASQLEFNAPSAVNFFRNQLPEEGASFAEVGSPANIKALAKGGADDILATLDKLKDAQNQAQGQFFKVGDDPIAEMGLNTVKTGVNAATKGLGGLVSDAVAPALRVLGRTGSVIGNQAAPYAGAIEAQAGNATGAVPGAASLVEQLLGLPKAGDEEKRIKLLGRIQESVYR